MLRISCYGVLILSVMAGCTTGSRQKELEKVAKDWSLTIRASQVVPIYPLCEDMAPGDIYLVTMPVDQQHEQFKKKGYLPLPNHLARIHPEHYGDFYKNSFLFEHENETIPAYWMREMAEGNPSAWNSAPRVGFPVYKYSVRRGAGLDAALPIQGIPVAINLTGAQAGDGSVALKDARSYGVGTLSLEQQVRTWADQPEVKDRLMPYAVTKGSPAGTPCNYLRVVNRVYLVKEFDVSLNASAASGGGILANLPTPAKVPGLRASGTPLEKTAEDYQTFLDHVNETLKTRRDGLSAAPAPAANPAPEDGAEGAADAAPPAAAPLEALAAEGEGEAPAAPVAPAPQPAPVPTPALPQGAGVALTVTAATASSVSLTETFATPLVVGYLGFDMRIEHENGSLELGPAHPTFEVVTNVASVTNPAALSGIQLDARTLRERLEAIEDAALRARLAHQVLSELGVVGSISVQDIERDMHHFNQAFDSFIQAAKTRAEKDQYIERAGRALQYALRDAGFLN